MKKGFVILLLSMFFTGCSNGFNSVNAGSSTPILNCDGCTDIAGAGGSLKLMQTTGQITVGDVMNQAVTTIPAGSWKTEDCTAHNNKLYLTVNNNEARLVAYLYRENTSCTDLDEIRTFRYQYSSLGTANDVIGGAAANIMRVSMAQVVSEPQNVGIRQYIVDHCKKDVGGNDYEESVAPNQDALSNIDKLAFDVSTCEGFGSSVGQAANQSTRFYTNGSILKIGEASDLTSLGYFTK